MKREIIIKKYHLIWEWQIVEGRKVLFGGFSRTKKDAKNDAGIVWRQNNVLGGLVATKKDTNALDKTT
jgi:hypothetical protein